MKLLPALILVSAACSVGQDAAGPREIAITMTEFAFAPASVQVTAGETVRFVAINEGRLEHELRLTSEHGVEDHLAEGHSGHAQGDSEQDNTIVVPPGETRTLEVTFDETAEFDLIACLLPGHFEVGMHAELTGLH